MRITIFDVETTGMTNDNQRIVQYASDSFLFNPESLTAHTVQEFNTLVKCDIPIPQEATDIHGVTDEMAKHGISQSALCNYFKGLCAKSDLIVAHNTKFDMTIMGETFDRLEIERPKSTKGVLCTMRKTEKLCKLPKDNDYHDGYKWPKLEELHEFLFGHSFEGAHDAMIDVRATKKCFVELLKRGEIDLD